MANVKHLYTGHGDPNDNPELELSGNAAGTHFYQDENDQSLWASVHYPDDVSGAYHDRWEKICFVRDLASPTVEVGPPLFIGQIGVGFGDALYIGWWNSSKQALGWRSIGATLGDWYEP